MLFGLLHADPIKLSQRLEHTAFWGGKTVLITGASSGIGEALAWELARSGAKVGLLARRANLLTQLEKRIHSAGGRAWALPADVTDRDAVHRAVAKLHQLSGPVDVLIANAGVGVEGKEETDSNVVSLVYAVNVLGPIYALEAVLPHMRERGDGHIAVISSGTALLPKLAASPAYASSKTAVARYFHGIRRELQQEGIAVTVIYPGFVHTEMTAGHKWKPFAVEPDKAAAIVCNGIEKKRRYVIFPRRAIWLGRLLQLVPLRWQLWGRQRWSGLPRR